MKTILLNGSNVVLNSNNSKYSYQFPGSGYQFKNSRITLSSLSIYYSWFNITSDYNNNTFSYFWINNTQVNVTIPNGFYTVSDLNEYLQNIMINNGHYLIDDNGDYVYYLEIQENVSRYSVQINCYATPNALPTGWAYPPNAPALVNNLGPRIVINSNAFRDIIGFNAGSYPATLQNTNQSFLSSFTPQISPVSSVLILCNLINNDLGNNQVLYSFSPDVQFGSQILISPNSHIWNEVLDGNYNNIQITFVNENYEPIKINDNNIVMVLTVGDDEEITLK